MELETKNGKKTTYPGVQAASSSSGAGAEAFDSAGGARFCPAPKRATQRVRQYDLEWPAGGRLPCLRYDGKLCDRDCGK